MVLVLDDVLADQIVLQVLDECLDFLLGPFELGNQGSDGCVPDGVDGVVALALGLDADRLLHPFVGKRGDALLEDGVDDDRHVFALGDADLGCKLKLGGEDRLHGGVAEEDRVEEVGFLDLGGGAFHHQDGVLAGGDDDLEIALLQFFPGRVGDESAVHAANFNAGDRACEGDVGDHQGCGGADHGEDSRIVVAVSRDDRRHDLGVVQEVFREQRADRAVDQAAGQGLRIGGPSFALEKGAGNLAAGVSLLLVVDGQREEALPFLGGLGGDGGDQHHGVAALDHDGAACLLRYLSGFDDDGFTAAFCLYNLFHVFGLRCCLVGVGAAEKKALRRDPARRAVLSTPPTKKRALRPLQ